MTEMTTRLGLMQEPKDFPLEKLLTISATEYAAMSGKSLADFTPYGVIGHRMGYDFDVEDGLIQELPFETEVVVDYRVITVMLPSLHSGIVTEHYAIGTALIPKIKIRADKK